MEYRGFAIYKESGQWFASSGGGVMVLGPFATEEEARAAVDEELG